MLANGTQAQAQSRAEEHEVDHDQQEQADVDDDVLLEEDGADVLDVAQYRHGDVGQPCALGHMVCAARLVEELIDQERGEPPGEDVDGEAADDLVGMEADRDDGMDQRHQPTGDDRRQCRDPGIARCQVDHHREERSGQHHAFHCDVGNTTALRKHAAERG